MAWIIEGDIKSFFDEIDHVTLVKILRKRIKDERFLNLVWKALRAGYAIDGVFHSSKKGTPQGSVVSPILANIYLDEFDRKVENWIDTYAKGKSSKTPKGGEYKKVQARMMKARKAIKEGNFSERSREELVTEIRADKQLLLVTTARADGWHRIKYVRYADDWMIGVIGPKEVAVEIRAKAERFMADQLGLTLSLEKTHIRRARTETAEFLGAKINISHGHIQKGTREGTPFIKRIGVGKPILKCPMPKILKRLSDKGFCTRDKHEPIHYGGWQNLDDWEIVQRYNNIFRGIWNYYSFAANKSNLSRVHYILKHSCAKTLAIKHRISSRAKIFRKYGKILMCLREVKGKTSQVKFFTPDDWKLTPDTFLNGTEKTMEEIFSVYYNRRSKSKLGLDCVICGSEDQVQMHHVKHIRKMGEKVKGFTKIMASYNRKQIPVCCECHGKIHKGEYDGISLKDFANPEKAAA